MLIIIYEGFMVEIHVASIVRQPIHTLAQFIQIQIVVVVVNCQFRYIYMSMSM